jgi:predicted acyltransferase
LEARTKTAWLVGGGAFALVLGELWSPLLPINKQLWTGSFVLLTSGAAALLLAACMWIDERRILARPLSVLVTFGRNPLAAFVLSELLNRLLLVVHWRQVSGRSISLRAFLFTNGFAWLPHPTLASHLFALGMVLLWYLVLRIFEARGWYWKL